MTFIKLLGIQRYYDLEILSGIGLALIILVFVALVASRRKRFQKNTEYLSESLPTLPQIIGIQIICGDCSGETISPQITYMNKSGRCHRCGSDSIMLASYRGIYLRSKLRARMASQERARSETHILPFKKASESSNGRSTRIAS